MAAKDQILAGASRLWGSMPLPLRRSVLHATNPSFLVGVVGVVHDRHQRVLLLEHRFRTPHPWGLPGGFINYDEDFAAALKRELDEELGLVVDVDDEVFDVELNVRGRYVSLSMLATTKAENIEIRSNEISGYLYCDATNIPERIHPHHAYVLRKYWNGLNRSTR